MSMKIKLFWIGVSFFVLDKTTRKPEVFRATLPCCVKIQKKRNILKSFLLLGNSVSSRFYTYIHH
jgi:hypothetical protein